MQRPLHVVLVSDATTPVAVAMPKFTSWVAQCVRAGVPTVVGASEAVLLVDSAGPLWEAATALSKTTWGPVAGITAIRVRALEDVTLKLAPLAPSIDRQLDAAHVRNVRVVGVWSDTAMPGRVVVPPPGSVPPPMFVLSRTTETGWLGTPPSRVSFLETPIAVSWAHLKPPSAQPDKLPLRISAEAATKTTLVCATRRAIRWIRESGNLVPLSLRGRNVQDATRGMAPTLAKQVVQYHDDAGGSLFCFPLGPRVFEVESLWRDDLRNRVFKTALKALMGMHTKARPVPKPSLDRAHKRARSGEKLVPLETAWKCAPAGAPGAANVEAPQAT